MKRMSEKDLGELVLDKFLGERSPYIRSSS
jgi:hypothetical protein